MAFQSDAGVAAVANGEYGVGKTGYLRPGCALSQRGLYRWRGEMHEEKAQGKASRHQGLSPELGSLHLPLAEKRHTLETLTQTIVIFKLYIMILSNVQLFICLYTK